MGKLKLVLVGIGGYGHGYVKELLENKNARTDFVIEGVVDPYPESAPGLPELKERQVPIFKTLEEFYQLHSADLAIISSPIHFHSSQTALALTHGSHVLCEKPVTATIQDAYTMLEARNRGDKLVGIGYQWSFSKAILDLKHDILAGKLGEPQLLKTLVLWPRDRTYYNRGWAGKQRVEADGAWILDSVLNNATAHFLHNMFYILGDQLDRSAKLQHVTAELYRANPIENYDTGIIRAKTDKGVDILFLASHTVNKSVGPIFEYRFTKATVKYEASKSGSEIFVEFADGTTKSYGDPNIDARRKMWIMMDAIKEGKIVPCGIEASLTLTQCINGAQESMPKICDFPEAMIKLDTAMDTIYVEDLGPELIRLYEAEKTPSETDLSWARSGKQIDLRDYKFFPSGDLK